MTVNIHLDISDTAINVFEIILMTWIMIGLLYYIGTLCTTEAQATIKKFWKTPNPLWYKIIGEIISFIAVLIVGPIFMFQNHGDYIYMVNYKSEQIAVSPNVDMAISGFKNDKGELTITEVSITSKSRYGKEKTTT